MADEGLVATSEEMVPSHEQGPAQHPAPDATSPATQDKVAAAFPRFSELPKELRDMVWEFAVEDGLERVFHAKRQNRRANRQNRRYYTMSFWNRPDPPGIVHACQESRAIAKKHLSFISTDTKGSGTWWNPKLDIMYIDQNFEAYWLRRLSQRGWNLAIQRVAIDWRLCIITMTPRHAPVGSSVYELDPCFAFVIVRLLQNYPGVRSMSIFYPEWQHTDLITPSEETLVKKQPISGLTDITTETNLIGNCLGRLRNSTRQIRLPDERERWLSILCEDDDQFPEIPKLDVLDLETRQFILHRSWPVDGPRGVHPACERLTRSLPRLGQDGWPEHIPTLGSEA